MGYIIGAVRSISEPGPPGPASVYLDVSDVVTGQSTFNPGQPAPVDPTEWKVFRNGIRLNYGVNSDWSLLPGGIIQFWASPGVPLVLNNDLIVVSYPTQL